ATLISLTFVALGVSFVRGSDSLLIIVFAMLFSPEIGSPLATGRAGGEGAGGIVMRLEDMLIVAVGCGWVLRTAYQRRHFGILKTPVNRAIILYVLACVVATLLGVIAGRVRWEAGLFHNLKYFEYFFLFFMILAHVRSRQTIRRILKAMLWAFFFVLIYGYTQIDLTGHGRVTAPFDPAEPNTFGGYIVLLMCIAFGILLTDKRFPVKAVSGGLLLFALPPLLFTLSRGSYIALLAGFLAFLAFSPQRLLVGVVLAGAVAALLLGYPLIPAKVQDRVMETFQRGDEYAVRVGGVDLDSSASARLVSYGQAIRVWAQYPLFGRGVTGTHFIDSQYFRVLAETGIVGLAAFLFMIWRLLKEIWSVHRRCDQPLLKGAALGFFCGIVAMLAHSLSVNSFIIIRIAEPFWMIAGLLLLIPRLPEGDEAEPGGRSHDEKPQAAGSLP
ncbi:MAG: O-antigen ligase family protein, partial [Lentisphaerae bacterium]|nr:O-antigen ligase family protein [Lentisphaerota bacterium]